MYRVYRMLNGRRIEVGTFESEKRARKMIALKARYGKYCFIELAECLGWDKKFKTE